MVPTNEPTTPITDALLAALRSALDESVLSSELRQRIGASDDATRSDARGSDLKGAIETRLTLQDILDEAIVSARPGDAGYPVRVFLGELAKRFHEDISLTLACGLNFYFRGSLTEETRARFGQELSQHYYAFCEKCELDEELVSQISPLLAQLMSMDLHQLKFEAVDNTRTFDSSAHERSTSSNSHNAAITAVESFQCRVEATGRIRLKAIVRT